MHRTTANRILYRMLKFPLWIVRPRTVQAPADAIGCARSGLPLLFSDADKMVAYLTAHASAHWDVRHITPEAGLEVLGDLHESGYAAICLDAHADGTGGHELTLAELILELRR